MSSGYAPGPSSSIPTMTGKAGKILATDGVNASWVDANNGGISSPPGYFIAPPYTGGTAQMSNGRLWCAGLQLARDTIIDQLLFRLSVVGTAGSLVRIGIWRPNALGAPGPLFMDAGTVDTSAGAGTTKIIDISGLAVASRTLTRGLWYFGGVGQGAPVTNPTVTCPGNQQGTQPPEPIWDVTREIDASWQGQAGVTGALVDFIDSGAIVNSSGIKVYARVSG